MNESFIIAIAATVLAWSVFSGVLARHNVTGPLVFMVVGYLLANPGWGPLAVDLEAGDVGTVAEVTLALVLFADASRVNVRALRHDLAMPVRLLCVGLPLTLLVGTGGALLVFGDLPWQLALLIGAALAPTDAALSVQVIGDQRVPMRLRRTLNVESGLNDGIATPVVTLAIALAATALGLEAHGEGFEAGAALQELGFGALAGLVLGVVGAVGINQASARGFALVGGRRLAVLATALAAYGLALLLGGNGFIAAFVAGIGLGARLDPTHMDAEDAIELPELGGEVLALVVWFLFGAALVPIALGEVSPWLIVYAMLSLTLVRMLPVAVSMVGTDLSREDVLFLGWFGPRGLASVVFALLAIEQLGETAQSVRQTVAAVAMTVLLSVVLHGVTAGPAGGRYDDVDDEDEAAPLNPRSSRVLSE